MATLLLIIKIHYKQFNLKQYSHLKVSKIRIKMRLNIVI